MSERHADTFDYFISPAGSDRDGDGGVTRPFATFESAVSAVARLHGGESPTLQRLSGGEALEIVCIAEPGVGGAIRRKPRFDYTVDPLAVDDVATTDDVAQTEMGQPAACPPERARGQRTPWPDLDTALAELPRLHGNTGTPLRPGERIRVSVREPFSATRRERGRQRGDRAAKYIFMAMTMVLVLPLVGILGWLLVKGAPALTWAFIVENPRDNMLAGGIWAPLVGTFYLVFFSLMAAAPIGILAGVYLNEYAGDNWLTRVVHLAVVNLAGVPSIVHALFGVGAFVAAAHLGYSVLAASCTLAVMTLPVIITSTKEALASVPISFREACWNMGASRWQTIRTIVLPNATGGILTGVILQVSRAAGETAPILFTGAVFYLPLADHGWESIFPYGLGDSCMALSYHLWAMTTQVKGDSARPEALEHIRYGTAVVLIGLVLAFNSAAIAVRVYLRSRKKW